MVSLWKFLLRKKQFTILLAVALSCAGLYALYEIPKESSPEVRIPIGIVSTVLPGASAADVELLVTNPIEDALTNLEHLNTLTSSSREGLSVITAEFDSNADLDASIQDLKDAVDSAGPELPDEALDPIVSEINFADQPILIISVAGNYAPAAMTALGEDLQEELRAVQGVSRVDVSGTAQREVQVVVDQAELARFGMNLSDVAAGLRSANASLPVGSLNVGNIEYPIRFEGDLRSPAEVEYIPLRTPQGEVMYLRDIAHVFNGLADATSISRTSTGGEPASPSLTLTVHKTSGGNIIRIADAVKERLNEIQRDELPDADIVVSFDLGEQVRHDLLSLTRVGFETMVLVMVVLFLTIGWRESLVASASIPLSFLIAFLGLWASGNTINFISLFSLILAIGILVDSGIVVVEAIHTRMQRYATKMEAALRSLEEYAWPLVGGTMTTVAVFVPLFFISGIVGKFIASIPFTIIFVLIASIFVALGIVPLIAILFTSRSLNRFEQIQEHYTARFQESYRSFLASILGDRRRENLFLGAMVGIFIIAMALPVTGAVRSVFFPSEDIDFVYVEIEKPEGTPLEETDLAVRRVEEALYAEQDIESFVTSIGASSAFSQNPQSGSRLANITALLKDDRTHTSTEIVEMLRKDFSGINSADVRVYEPSEGPPSGAPIVLTLSGDDLADLEVATLATAALLEDTPGAAEVDSSTKSRGIEFVLTIDKVRAAQAGLSPLAVAQTLRTAISGSTATTIREEDQDIDVTVKLNVNPSYGNPSETRAATLEALRALTIGTPGGPVLLGSVLSTDIGRASAVIRHEDGDRIESVTAYTAAGATTPQVIAAFQEKANSSLSLPDGVRLHVGGENEDIDQSFKEMFFAFIAGIVLMLGILVLEFNSFRHTLYLLSIIPLSLVGVMVGLFLTNQPLSFTSLLGVIALAGVIINHAIILLDSMHRIGAEQADLSVREVAIEASVSRLRPIVLTTITTVIGMIPLTHASALWGPLAFAIMFGLSFSMVLTLVLLPVLYSRWPGKAARL